MASQPDFDDPVKLWPAPDMGVLRHNRRAPPVFPKEVFGPFWSEWITVAAAGAAAPADYTGCTLLAFSAQLVGHARWVSPWPSWVEPGALWIGNVGDPSSGKSPAADLLITILRGIEVDIASDFPAAHREWMKEKASAGAHKELWESDVKLAAKNKKAPPDMPVAAVDPPEPIRARITTSDSTTEMLAALAAAHPKGIMLIRDELAGWHGSLGRYSKSGADRAFWVEAYGGRPHTVDRVKNKGLPIVIERLALGLFGGIQPDRLCDMMDSPDDGLVARFLWAWPNKVPARRPLKEAGASKASTALRLLYDLPLVPDDKGGLRPFICGLSPAATDLFTPWWEKWRAIELAGPLSGMLGKAPGHVIRIALCLEHLWWCGTPGIVMPPPAISDKAVAAAIALVVGYFHPMAERVYGDAAIPEIDRGAATIARWILKEKPSVINAQKLRRAAGLPGLREIDKVKAALGVLVEADWVMPAPSRAGPGGGRMRDDFLVNPRLKGAGNV
jgi:hypothetical protein